jgi:hypothetical protein
MFYTEIFYPAISAPALPHDLGGIVCRSVVNDDAFPVFESLLFDAINRLFEHERTVE